MKPESAAAAATAPTNNRSPHLRFRRQKTQIARGMTRSAVSSLHNSNPVAATASSTALALDGRVNRQAQKEDREAFGVELLEVAVLEGRVEQVGGCQQGRQERTA